MRKVTIRFILLFVFALLSVISVSAQTYEEYLHAERERYTEYVDKHDSEFKAFRDKVNAAYAEQMGKAWESVNAAEPIIPELIPEPIDPIVAAPDATVTSDPLMVDKIVIPSTVQAPAPPKPMVERPVKSPEAVTIPEARVAVESPIIDHLKPQEYDPAQVPSVEMNFESITDAAPSKIEVAAQASQTDCQPVNSGFEFAYYGTKCYITIDESHRFSLSKVSESAVANSWKTLSEDRYTQIILDALDWRDYLQLSDWGYVRFVEAFAQSFFGASGLNEARVMQMFILVQSGYEARIARADSNLVLLLPFSADVYSYVYLEIEGEKYYVMDRNIQGGSLAIFNHKFPNEQRLSLSQVAAPKLDIVLTPKRRLSSNRYDSLSVEVSTNENLIKFYNDVPHNSSWSGYSRASLSSEVKGDLYPTFTEQLAGKSQSEAANMLLNFVQTAFEYKTDGEQFGVERPLFGDESIYYPYSDCEDRSILYSILVRDLLGLEVVLLDYPEHIATAVHFEQQVEGDYLMIDGKKFLVCDPTYIGAQIGLTMPQYKSVSATVIAL
ncbi:MAG: hypothetical protein SNG34_00360 [Rikenellaceae bacterium]